jgi:hypothetical protein
VNVGYRRYVELLSTDTSPVVASPGTPGCGQHSNHQEGAGDTLGDELARLLLGPGPSGYGVAQVMGAVCTSWNPVTYQNTVSDGANRWTNLPVLAPTLMTTGRVALLNTAGLPMILGPLFVYEP